MQLHAKSLADAGFQVDFVGYAGTQVPEFLEKEAKVRLIHLSPARKLPADAPRWMYVILAALRTLWQFYQLFLVLFSLPSPSYILCQVLWSYQCL
jgi:beta-1,4-mannosyltransferase